MRMRTAWRALAMIATIALVLSSSMAVRAAQYNIVAFGASIVAGYGVGAQASFGSQLEAMLRAKGYDVSVSIAGIPGDNSVGMLNRLDSAVPPGTRLVLLGLYFINDSRTGIPLAQHEANRREILDRLHRRGIKVIEVGPDGVPLQADHLHPTAEGQAMMAKRIMPQVEAALGGTRRH